MTGRRSPLAVVAPYLAAGVAAAATAWATTATFGDPSASGIIEEGVDAGGAAAVTAVLVGIPTLAVAGIDVLLVRRRSRAVTVGRAALGVILSAWTALMVLSVVATACDGSCTEVPAGPPRAALAVSVAVLGVGAAIVTVAARSAPGRE